MVTQGWTGAWASPSSLPQAQTAGLLIPARASSPGCVCAQGSHNAFRKIVMPVAEEVSMASPKQPAPWELEHIHGTCRQESPAGEKEEQAESSIYPPWGGYFGHCTLKRRVSLSGD